MHEEDCRLLACSFVMTLRSNDLIAWHRFAYLMTFRFRFNNPAGEIHQTLTIVRFLNGSNCDLRVILNRACAERSCESIEIELHSLQLPLSFEILPWIFFPVYFFYFLIIFYSIFRGKKNGGSMDPVHILMDPVHGPGPRRGSMDQGSMFCTFPVWPAEIQYTFKKSSHVVSVSAFAYSSVNLLGTFRRISQLWDNAQAWNLKNCLL